MNESIILLSEIYTWEACKRLAFVSTSADVSKIAHTQRTRFKKLKRIRDLIIQTQN